MNDTPRRKQDNSRKRFYVRPEAKCISLNNEEVLLEFCRGKAFNVKDVKEMVSVTLKACKS